MNVIIVMMSFEVIICPNGKLDVKFPLSFCIPSLSADMHYPSVKIFTGPKQTARDLGYLSKCSIEGAF